MSPGSKNAQYTTFVYHFCPHAQISDFGIKLKIHGAAAEHENIQQ
jgi:hypothetical protein